MPCIQSGSRVRSRGWGQVWAGCRRAIPAALTALLLSGGATAAPTRTPAAQQRLRAWGDGQRLELLPLQQSSLEVLARSRVTLVIRPHDLPHPYAALWLMPPPTLDARALARTLHFCRIDLPRRSDPVRCLEPLPVRLEVRRDGVRLELQRPLDPASAYGLQLLLRNPLQQGFHPLRLFGLRPERPEPDYLGTWLLQTDAEAE